MNRLIVEQKFHSVSLWGYGRKCLVTGATSGIGNATVRLLLKQGQ